MLTLHATVLNVFKAPEGKNKEGESYGGGYKVQLQGANVLKNGETRIDLVTLSSKDPKPFQDALGKEIMVNVGAFVSGKSIQYYIPEKFKVRAVKI